MDITILTYLEREGDTSYDPVVDQIAQALRAGGHTTNVLGGHADLVKLVAGLTRKKPDLVFNVMEMFGDSMYAEIGIQGLLDLVCVPYTGVGPGESYLQQDKALAKKLLAFHNVRYPEYAVFTSDAMLETFGNLRLPLFVKPLRADASIGIDGKSIVRNSTELMKRVLYIQEELHDAALAEEYIEGREFYIGVLGNQEPVAFPPIEMDFSRLDPDKPHIVDHNAKWEKGTAEYEGTTAVLAELPDEMTAKLQKSALEAYRALRVRDYGRIDMRVADTGEIYVIEVNASCYLERTSEFATAAAAAGIEYDTLINRIAELAIERQRQQRVQPPSMSGK